MAILITDNGKEDFLCNCVFLHSVPTFHIPGTGDPVSATFLQIYPIFVSLI